MAEPTPGPWEVHSDRWVVATRGEHKGEIIVSPTYWIESAKEEAAANARLISAAPDLLDALCEIIDYQGGAENALADDYVMERVRAAIAKAVGAV